QWMERVLCTRCKVAKLWPYQLELSLDIDNGKHVFCVIATGMGKTLVLMAGAIAASARGERGIALFIVPTKTLVEQQVLASRRGLRALAINQDTVRDARLAGRDLFKELANGDDVRMGVMTPKMLFEADMTALLRSDAFVDSVRWVSIDEAQLVRQEGVFQAGYKSLLFLHVRLNRSTTYALATATAPPAAALSMAKSLGLHPGQYTNARYSVDRPNLKYIPRFFQHPTTTGQALDTSFIFPIDMQKPADIIQTLVFRDAIYGGDEIGEFLDTLIPAHIPGREGLIKAYNSMGSHKYRTRLKEDFDSGKVRVLIVTDTATYGLDIAGVRRVVIFDLPKDFGRFEQQLGRAGRDREPAEVIAFAPEWVREPAPGFKDNSAKGMADAARRTELPPVVVRWFNPKPTLCPRGVSVEHNCEPFVNRGRDCCAPIHDAEGSKADLAMNISRISRQAAAPPRLRSNGTYPPLEKPMKESLGQLLDHWRHNVWADIRPSDDDHDPCECFLPEYVMEVIVDRAHVCTSLENLRIIADGFDYMDEYGPRLLEYLAKILGGFKQIFEE
ncbi:P-loop containing nucleoside triphosphate hydrolase protein, partial [Mycena albidolilacea]